MQVIVGTVDMGRADATRAGFAAEGALTPSAFVECIVRIAASRTSAIGPELRDVYVDPGPCHDSTAALRGYMGPWVMGPWLHSAAPARPCRCCLSRRCSESWM